MHRVFFEISCGQAEMCDQSRQGMHDPTLYPATRRSLARPRPRPRQTQTQTRGCDVTKRNEGRGEGSEASGGLAALPGSWLSSSVHRSGLGFGWLTLTGNRLLLAHRVQSVHRPRSTVEPAGAQFEFRVLSIFRSPYSLDCL